MAGGCHTFSLFQVHPRSLLRAAPPRYRPLVVICNSPPDRLDTCQTHTHVCHVTCSHSWVACTHVAPKVSSCPSSTCPTANADCCVFRSLLSLEPGREPSCSFGFLHSTLPLPVWASLVAQLVKNPPAMQEAWVPSLSWEDPLEKGKAAHSTILAWRIPCTV